MQVLQIIASVAGVLGFLLSLALWLVRFVPFTVRDAQVSYYAAPEAAHAIFVSVVICNRSARPLSLLGCSLLSDIPAAKCSSKGQDVPELPSPVSGIARRWLQSSKCPFEDISTFPIVLPPYASHRICISCYTRTASPVLSAVCHADETLSRSWAAAPTNVPPLGSQPTVAVPISLRVLSTTSSRLYTVSAAYLLRP